jgi:N-formylglutamate amidohydrolase
MEAVPEVLTLGEHLEVLQPQSQTVPLVFASPHSGSNYPAEFVAASRLDPVALRRSEDCFVDRLFCAAPDYGAPLLRALFPRAFIDPNREPFELDPAMFEDSLPPYANTASARVAAGLGTIARVVTNGQEIYRGKLRFAEAAERIGTYYRPYHRTLQDLLEGTRRRFGCYLLIDCHSMPSIGGPMDPDAGRGRADFVIGDCFGSSCDDAVASTVESSLKDMGFTVLRNRPYAGGYTTSHYGKPSSGLHAVQIEINRALYMDENAIEAHAGLEPLAEKLTRLIAALAASISARDLKPK